MHGQLEALAERIAELPKAVSAGHFYKQMERLEEIKAAEEERLRGVDAQAGTLELPASVKDYEGYLAAIRRLGGVANTPNPQDKSIQTQIIQALIHKVEIKPDGIRLHYFAGQDTLSEKTPKNAKGPEAVTPSGPFANKNLTVNGSNTLKNGAGKGARTLDLHVGNVAL